jgi:uncharacterized OB-fold protein
LEWRRASGQGEVYSYTIVRLPVQTYKNPLYFKNEIPYAVGLIELDEKVRMYARVVHCPIDKIEIGMKVEVTFLKLNSQINFPAFRPRKSQPDN